MDEGHEITLKEATAARNMCRHWRNAIFIGTFFNVIGLIWVLLSLFEFRKAKNTLRTPILVESFILLLLVVPAMYAVSNYHEWWPLYIFMLVGVFQVLGYFFVTLAVFRQWSAHFENVRLKNMIEGWERLSLFVKVPFVVVLSWFGIFGLMYDVPPIDLWSLTRIDIFWLAIIWMVFVISGTWCLVLEYRIVKRFEMHHWGIMSRRKYSEAKKERQARRKLKKDLAVKSSS